MREVAMEGWKYTLELKRKIKAILFDYLRLQRLTPCIDMMSEKPPHPITGLHLQNPV